MGPHDTDVSGAVAKALVNKGSRLLASGRPEEARTTLDEVLKRYERATSPTLKDLVESARSLLAQLG